MSDHLVFEEMVEPLKEQIEVLKRTISLDSPMIDELNVLEKQLQKMLTKIYENLEPWQYMLVARHQNRPTGSSYIDNLITDFVPLSGDRTFMEDTALKCGIGKFEGMPIAVIGHNKGYDTEDRIQNNFGMAHPEGYRKVIRILELASRFNLPVVAFIDTKGAAANKASEERNQSQALAECIRANFKLTVPLISVIVGEGGSGGAIAVASGHSIMMLKYSIFSVASPDACAAILWKDRKYSSDSALALKITSQELLKIGAIDKEIPEPVGGAHRFPEQAFNEVRKALKSELKRLQAMSVDELRNLQRNKFTKF